MKFFAKSRGKIGELYLYDEINMYFGITPTAVTDALKALGSVDELHVYIDSPGGNVFAGITIHNLLKRFEAKKIVFIDGIAASIASYVVMAGDEVRIASNGRMMIHDAWGYVAGNARELRAIADKLDSVTGTIREAYVARTGRPDSEVKAWMEDETWMTASEALANGFADSIEEMTAAKVEDNTSALYAKYRNTPADVQKRASSASSLIARANMKTEIFLRDIPAKAA